MSKIEVRRRILDDNERLAAESRERLRSLGVYTLNLMASPGAGKTSLIAQTIRALEGKLRIGVIEGDIASSIDADRLAELGVPTHQINTGGDCHLEAWNVAEGLSSLPLNRLDLLFIENVGNLVCPTAFDLGEELKVMISSVAEGDDKPQKYPAMFQAVDVLILNKTDLLGVCPFERESFLAAVTQLNPEVSVFEVSCLTGEGIQAWGSWLEERVREARLEAGQS